MPAQQRRASGEPQRLATNGATDQHDHTSGKEARMNYYDTLIEVADNCPAIEAQVPGERAGKKTKAVVEYELLVKHAYRYTEADIAFRVFAILHDIPKGIWPTQREKF